MIEFPRARGPTDAKIGVTRERVRERGRQRERKKEGDRERERERESVFKVKLKIAKGKNILNLVTFYTFALLLDISFWKKRFET